MPVGNMAKTSESAVETGPPTESSAAPHGIFLSTGVGIRAVALPGDSTPEGGTLVRAGPPSLNNRRQIAFEAGVLRVRLRDDGREIYEHTGADGIAILSGGTDGEDGPTDAAGAVLDDEILQRARSLGLDPHEYLAINNSYPFFEQCGGLLKTGPTHTNVMDVRVALIQHRRSDSAPAGQTPPTPQ